MGAMTELRRLMPSKDANAPGIVPRDRLRADAQQALAQLLAARRRRGRLTPHGDAQLLELTTARRATVVVVRPRFREAAALPAPLHDGRPYGSAGPLRKGVWTFFTQHARDPARRAPRRAPRRPRGRTGCPRRSAARRARRAR